MDTTERYGAMLLDPPWAFRVWSKDTGQGRSAEAHYPTMSMADIAKLPVYDMLKSDAFVFMWAVWPSLPDALKIGEAWGLTYKTCAFDWAKTRQKTKDRFVVVNDPANWHLGMGYYTRANTEPCLLFTKGKPKRKDKGVRMLVVEPYTEHSRKPDEVHRRIMRFCDGPYCEMFARRPYPGWDVWGNQVESTISLEV